jgi:hypothetical protein
MLTIPNPVRRVLGIAGVALAGGAVLAGCSVSVPNDDVAAKIGAALTQQGVNGTAVTCPADLEAEIGKSVACTYTLNGKQLQATAVATSVQDDQVNFDINFTPPVLPATQIGSVVDGEARNQGVGTEGGATCPSALIGEVGQTLDCEYTIGGLPVGATVAVTAVDGTEVSYEVEFEIASVAADEVAVDVDEIAAQQGLPVDGPAVCPTDLVGRIGESLHCEVTAGGWPVDAVVTVNEVTGDAVNYNVEFEAAAVSSDLLSQDVSTVLGQEYTDIEGAVCYDDLQPVVDSTVVCTVSHPDGGATDVTVRVISTDNGLIQYNFDEV